MSSSTAPAQSSTEELQNQLASGEAFLQDQLQTLSREALKYLAPRLEAINVDIMRDTILKNTEQLHQQEANLEQTQNGEDYKEKCTLVTKSARLVANRDALYRGTDLATISVMLAAFVNNAHARMGNITDEYKQVRASNAKERDTLKLDIFAEAMEKADGEGC